MPDASVSEQTGQSSPAARAKGYSPRGFRVVLAIYLVVVVSFIAWTAQLVIGQMFFENAVPTPGERLPALPLACETGLKELGGALEPALRASLWAKDEEAATSQFEAILATPWQKVGDVERACAADPAGAAAYAAMVRERRAQEGWARRHARETIAAAGASRRFLPTESAPRDDVSR